MEAELQPLVLAGHYLGLEAVYRPQYSLGDMRWKACNAVIRSLYDPRCGARREFGYPAYGNAGNSAVVNIDRFVDNGEESGRGELANHRCHVVSSGESINKLSALGFAIQEGPNVDTLREIEKATYCASQRTGFIIDAAPCDRESNLWSPW